MADNEVSLKGWFLFISELASESTLMLNFHSIGSALTTLTPLVVKTSLKQIGEKDVPKRSFLFFYS